MGSTDGSNTSKSRRRPRVTQDTPPVVPSANAAGDEVYYGIVMDAETGRAFPAPLASAAALDANALGGAEVEAVPAKWEDRAKMAWEYYIMEPLVKNCINSWRSFALGEDIGFTCGDPDVEKAFEAFARSVKLSRFVRDCILQLLVKGDAVAYRVMDGTAISELVCVNPISCTPKYEAGTLTEMKQKPESTTPGVPAGEEKTLSLDQVLHLRWDAPPFSPRGNSMVLPAFESIELLRDYRRAERAIAKRWTTPLRLIKVGGQFGAKVVMPDQKMLKDVAALINKMNPKTGLVVPFYVDVDTYGAEGEVLNVEEKVKEVKEDIIVSLGMSRALVTGDGPNFATASVSFQKMVIMIRDIKQASLDLLMWVIDAWRVANGHEDVTILPVINDLDPSDETDYKKLLMEMYDRKLISRRTLLMRMGIDPDAEAQNQEGERGKAHLMDEKQVKPIVDLVNAGVLAPETAQRELGLNPAENKPVQATEADRGLGGPSARADVVPDRVCDDCAYFDRDGNRCQVTREDTTFDTPACRFFDSRYPAPDEE